MNEWFKKTFGTIKEKWGKWTIVQKVILIGIIVLVIAAVIVLFAVSGNKAAVSSLTHLWTHHSVIKS